MEKALTEAEGEKVTLQAKVSLPSLLTARLYPSPEPTLTPPLCASPLCLRAALSWVCAQWKTRAYTLVLPLDCTVGFLKMQVAIQTNVKPQHQKLILRSVKGKLDDLQPLRSLHLRDLDKLMIIGTEEKDLPSDQADLGDVVDDLDDDLQYAAEDESVMQAPEHMQKLERYKTLISINFINPPRPGKRLLVLDLDYTLFDMKTEADDYTRLKRPFTHRTPLTHRSTHRSTHQPHSMHPLPCADDRRGCLWTDCGLLGWQASSLRCTLTTSW